MGNNRCVTFFNNILLLVQGSTDGYDEDEAY